MTNYYNEEENEVENNEEISSSTPASEANVARAEVNVESIASEAQAMVDNDATPITITAMIDSGGYAEIETQSNVTIEEFLRNQDVDIYNASVSRTPKPSSGLEPHPEMLNDLSQVVDENMFYNVSSKKQTGGKK